MPSCLATKIIDFCEPHTSISLFNHIEKKKDIKKNPPS